MEILKISGLAFVIITASAILKQTKPEFSIQVVLLATVMMLGYVLSLSTSIYDYLEELCEISGIKGEYLKIVFKITVISYISEFTASLCRDAGESAVAVKAVSYVKQFAVNSQSTILQLTRLKFTVMNVLPAVCALTDVRIRI